MSTEKVTVVHTGSNYAKKTIYDRESFGIEHLSNWLDGVEHVGFEDFSYDSKEKSSSLFQIAEFSGALRRYLYTSGKTIHRYPPTTIKAFASGNGAASKFIMMHALREQYPDLIPPEINCLTEGESPQADMVDAFWMAEATRVRLAHLSGIDVSSSVLGRASAKKRGTTLLEIEVESPIEK